MKPTTKDYLKLLNLVLSFELKDKQEEALELIFKDKSILAVLPTSYGKTIIAIIQALYSATIKNKKSIIVAPLRSLTHEHIDSLREYGLKPMLDDGGHPKTVAEYMYNKYDVVVSTFEKQDSIIRKYDKHSFQQQRDLIYKNIDVVIIDEIHNIEDDSRGVNLESYIMSLRFLYPHIKIVALSATIGNKEDFAKWLDAELVYAPSSERPVPLDVSVIPFNAFYAKKLYEAKMVYLLNTLDINKGDKIMIAVTSVGRTKKIVQRLSSVSKEKDISFYMKHYKMGWHYSASRGMSEDDRMAVEWAYEYDSLPNIEEYPYTKILDKNKQVTEYICRKDWLFDNYDLTHGIDLIVCTPTLIVGRNLPVNKIIVFDHIQYTYYHGPQIIPSNRLQQTIGRAGRLKYAYLSNGDYDPNYVGKAVILVPYGYEDEMYERATVPFNIESVLSKKLGEKILAWISSRIVKTEEDIINFLGNAFDPEIKDNIELIRKKIKFLLDFRFISIGIDGSFIITDKGKETIRYYVQPETVVAWGKKVKEFIKLLKVSPEDFKLDFFIMNLMHVDEFLENICLNERDEKVIKVFFRERNYSYHEHPAKAFMFCFPEFVRTYIKSISKSINDLFVVPKQESASILKQFSRLMLTFKNIYSKTSLKHKIETANSIVASGIYDIELANLISLPKIGLVRAKRLLNNGINTKQQIIKAYRSNKRSLCGIIGMNMTGLTKFIRELIKIK